MIRLQGGNHLPVGTRRGKTRLRRFEAAQVVRGAFSDGTRVWIGVGFGRQGHDLAQCPCTYSCGSPWFIRVKCGNGKWGTWSWFTYDWVGFLQQRWQVAWTVSCRYWGEVILSLVERGWLLRKVYEISYIWGCVERCLTHGYCSLALKNHFGHPNHFAMKFMKVCEPSPFSTVLCRWLVVHSIFPQQQ